MAVCTESNIARFYISGFCHQLVADPIAPVDVGHAIFRGKLIADMEMSCIVKLACRNKVVVDQNDLIRIPQLFKAHLFKFLRHERNKNVVDHDAVNIYGHDITRLYRPAGVMFNDLLNYSLSHFVFLPFSPNHSACAWP